MNIDRLQRQPDDSKSLSLKDQVKSHSIFKGFSDEELLIVLANFRVLELGSRAYLLLEGIDTPGQLYIVLHGSLEVIKEVAVSESDLHARNFDGKFVIARVGSGDVIGELSFIAGGHRSASILAVEPCLLLSLDRIALLELEKDHPRISSHFMKNLLGYVAERVKLTSANEVVALKTQLHNSILNSKANLFFSYIIGILCVYNLAIHTITNLSMDVNRASLISAVIIALFCLALVVMIRHSRLPKRMFGLTRQNWNKALKESLSWTAVIVLVMVGVKWFLIHYVARYEGLPLFDFDPTGQKYLGLNFLLYGMHSPIQEFIARGVLQGSLSHFFAGRNVTLRAILISNALFSATHVHLLGGLLGVIVFVPGLFWGWLYSRHETLIGVSISHIIIGWTGLFFLNLESLF